MERITLRTYLRDKAMDRDVDTDIDNDTDTKGSTQPCISRWHRVNGQAMPASAKVKPKWVVIRRKDKNVA